MYMHILGSGRCEEWRRRVVPVVYWVLRLKIQACCNTLPTRLSEQWSVVVTAYWFCHFIPNMCICRGAPGHVESPLCVCYLVLFKLSFKMNWQDFQDSLYRNVLWMCQVHSLCKLMLTVAAGVSLVEAVSPFNSIVSYSWLLHAVTADVCCDIMWNWQNISIR